MSRETQALLEAFEHLPEEEKRVFTEEVLRRSLPFDSGPLRDEEIGAVAAALFDSLDEEDANPRRGEVWLIDFGQAGKTPACLGCGRDLRRPRSVPNHGCPAHDQPARQFLS